MSKTRWIVYGVHDCWDPVLAEWFENEVEHYSTAESLEEAEYDAIEEWASHDVNARITGRVSFDSLS